MMYLTMNTDTTGNLIIPCYYCVTCIDLDILQLLVLIQNSDIIVTDYKSFVSVSWSASNCNLPDVHWQLIVPVPAEMFDVTIINYQVSYTFYYTLTTVHYDFLNVSFVSACGKPGGVS